MFLIWDASFSVRMNGWMWSVEIDTASVICTDSYQMGLHVHVFRIDFWLVHYYWRFCSKIHYCWYKRWRRSNDKCGRHWRGRHFLPQIVKYWGMYPVNRLQWNPLLLSEKPICPLCKTKLYRKLELHSGPSQMLGHSTSKIDWFETSHEIPNCVHNKPLFISSYKHGIYVTRRNDILIFRLL